MGIIGNNMRIKRVTGKFLEVLEGKVDKILSILSSGLLHT